MLFRISLLFFCLIKSQLIWGQVNHEESYISEANSKALQFSASRAIVSGTTLADRTYFDVVRQELEFDVDPAIKGVKGQVISTFKVLRKGYKSITLDLSNSLKIDSLFSPNGIVTWKHENEFIEITFPTEFVLNTPYQVIIKYHGVPEGSFSADTSKAGSPVLWTLSEPYGAKLWWPCKQDLQDKIEKLDVIIRNPDKYKSVSNGVKTSEAILTGNIRETRFEHNYPVVTYLVAIAVADYREFRDTIEFRNTKMPFINYVYPETEAKAKKDLENFNKTFFLFDSLFGEYPFLKEHYGHAEFTRGGGMEHQTMSFMASFNHELVAHELAHQWYGDKLTCGSWEDLWLNEGFATYMTGITYDFLYEGNEWLNWKQFMLNDILKNTDGSVYIEDTTNQGRMFNQQLTYRKGAYLLHMLRWKMGNDAFFDAIKTYTNDPELSYGYAKTDNLIYHLKLAGGEGIDGFFDTWYYRKGWPSYKINWYQDISNKLYIVINQEQSYIWEGTFFQMELPVHLYGNSSDTLLRLNNKEPNQEFIIPLNYKIRSLSFDPELWILSGNNEVEKVDYKHELIAYKIAPNPVRNELVVYSSSSNLGVSNMEITNIEGKMVWQGSVGQGLSSAGFKIDIEKLKPGVYFLSVSDYYSTSLLKFIKM